MREKGKNYILTYYLFIGIPQSDKTLVSKYFMYSYYKQILSFVVSEKKNVL